MGINKNVQFGKTKDVLLVEFGIGDIGMTYSEVRNNKIILAFKEYSEPHEIDVIQKLSFNSFDEMKPPLVFSFSNPKSIDALIHQLEDMKRDLIKSI